MGFNVDENEDDFRKGPCRFILVVQEARCQTEFKTIRRTGNYMDEWLLKVCCQVGFLYICLGAGTATPPDERGHV